MPKPFLTYEQQLIKLRDEKHLVITDESATCCKLRQISYYSLVSGYKHLFRIPSQKIYKGGTTFEEIVSLYEFDESLILLKKSVTALSMWLICWLILSMVFAVLKSMVVFIVLFLLIFAKKKDPVGSYIQNVC